MECEICFESFDSEERTPLVLACKCRKVMCHCCVTRRLDSTARCPYCDLRWSVRNYISQCKQITPTNMLSQLLDLQKAKVSETPHTEKYSNLGSGELRRYYEKAKQDIITKATEKAAEQVRLSIARLIRIVDKTIKGIDRDNQLSHMRPKKHMITNRLKKIRVSRRFSFKNCKERLRRKQLS